MHSHKCTSCKKTWECDYPYCSEPDSALCLDCIEVELLHNYEIEPEDDDNGSPGEVD